jgi:hypothetical protein
LLTCQPFDKYWYNNTKGLRHRVLLLYSFSEYLWCSSIAFFVVWKLLFYKGCCNCLNVIYLRIFILLSECCFYNANFRMRHPFVFSIILYIFSTANSPFSWICYYSSSVDVMLFMFMLVFEFCYSAFVYVMLWEYALFSECLFYSPNVVILGILLFLESLCYSLNVCVIVTCCCYTVNVFILRIFALFSERLYYSLFVDILRVLLLFSECQYSVNIYVMLWNLYYSLNVFVVLWMSVLLSYRVLKAYNISKSVCFASRMSVLTYVAEKDECYSRVNSEVWGSNPVLVYSSWWRFHKP